MGSYKMERGKVENRVVSQPADGELIDRHREVQESCRQFQGDGDAFTLHWMMAGVPSDFPNRLPILSWLLIGNQQSAGHLVPASERTSQNLTSCVNSLKAQGVGYVINCAIDLENSPLIGVGGPNLLDGFEILEYRVPMSDHSDFKLEDVSGTMQLLDSLRDSYLAATTSTGSNNNNLGLDSSDGHAEVRQNKVLVHCNAGISRSATIVIMFLMWKFGWSFVRAQRYVLERRPCINVSTFEAQLKDWGTYIWAQ